MNAEATDTHPNTQSNTEQRVSSFVFRIRRTLVSQLARTEKLLEERMTASQERFVTKDDLSEVLRKVRDFQSEVNVLLHKLEDQVQSLKGRSANGALNQSQNNGTQEPKNKKFADLNLFNLRKKYHQFSLTIRGDEVDSFGYDPVFEQFVLPLFEFLYESYWRVEISGLENVPKQGGSLLVANHSGGLPYDATMLKIAMAKNHPHDRELRFLVEDFIYHLPFIGSMIGRFGGVRGCQENAQLLLNTGWPLVVFPEGVKGLGKLYKDRYRLARFGRGGFVKLCLRTRMPMVPVAFIGPEEIHPMLYRETFFARKFGIPYFPITPTFPWLGLAGLIPLPSKWSIQVLPAVSFEDYGPGAENDRVLVARKAREVKESIQDAVNTGLKNRRSIWY